MSNDVSRRDVFAIAGAAGLAVAIPGAARGQHPAPAQEPSSLAQARPSAEAAASGPEESLLFFNEAEAAFITAVIDHLIPDDETWPGAVSCGVLTYLDRQLAGAYGAGHRLYLQGPWRSGTPQQGYQLPHSPAELYRTAMDAMFRHLKQRYADRQFGQLDRSEQEKLLFALERGELDLGGVPGAVFFETILANTIEGFFADPAYGGNRNMAAWRMIGFPGAYAQYVTLVEYHGVAFGNPPISMAQVTAPHGHGHHSQESEGHHGAGMAPNRPMDRAR